MSTNRPVRIVLFVVLAGVYAANFKANLFGLGLPRDPQNWRADVFETFQNDADQAVIRMLERTRKDGLGATGGMMIQVADDTLYYSAYGLQGKLFSLWHHFSRQSLDAFVGSAHLAMSVLFGATMALFALHVFRTLGFGAAAAFVVLGNLSDWMVFAGRNLYLVYFLHLLPFILSFVLYPLMREGGRFRFPHYVAAVAGAVLLKSLCYFDYSSNIVLSTATGVIFHGVLNGQPVRQIVRRSLVVIAASAVAVALAIVATGLQRGFHLHDMSRCFDHLVQKAAVRSYTPDPAAGAPPEVSVFQIFEQYLTLPMITLPFQQPFRYRAYLSLFAFISLLLPCFLFAYLDGARFPRVERERRLLTGLAWATAWGLASTLSWVVLMKGHMFHHVHMNGMIFYIPYLPLLYTLAGKVLGVTAAQIADFVRRRMDTVASAAAAPPPPVRKGGRKPK